MSEFWEDKKVLVTGHTGFKGSWLLMWLLQEKAKICGFSLRENENSLFKRFISENRDFINSFDHNIGDINNFNSLSEVVNQFKPEIVFHLAAQPIVSDSYKYPIKTFQTNIIGSINLLESLKSLSNKCVVIMVTTDKVYKNNEWCFGYREIDPLGGHDPYSASKAAAEIVINSWRSSFGSELNNIFIATARSGNVIGGGDWSPNRIVPDAICALSNNKPIRVRNPKSRRPWQHVLEPLNGYMVLAEKLFYESNNKFYQSSFNFGPDSRNNKTVEELVNEILIFWEGEWQKSNELENMHEASLLNLNTDKALHYLGWYPKWNFQKTVKNTVEWYLHLENKSSAFNCCIDNLNDFLNLNK